MHVSLMARLNAHVANIHLYRAMLVGLQNIGGVVILVFVHLYSNAKVIVHTPRGSSSIFWKLLLQYFFLIYQLCKSMCCHQTPKRGRLKGHFPPKCILVFDINTSELTVC